MRSKELVVLEYRDTLIKLAEASESRATIELQKSDLLKRASEIFEPTLKCLDGLLTRLDPINKELILNQAIVSELAAKMMRLSVELMN